MKKKIKSGYNNKGNCRLCKEPRTDEGHDPCIANLPGVLFACCGHGEPNGYIKFVDGRSIFFIPMEMDLDTPTAHVVTRSVPVFVPGDKRRILKYSTGKEHVKEGEFEIVPGQGRKLLYERRLSDDK